MKPIKLQRMKRTNFYTPIRRVWFQKNDDNAEIERLDKLIDKRQEQGHSIKKMYLERKRNLLADKAGVSRRATGRSSE
jgi:hypothetical protein